MIKPVLLLLFALNLALANLTDEAQAAYDSGDEQKAAAIAIIFYVGAECSNDGRERMLGVGLVRSNDYVSWCDSDAWAYCEYIKPIECSINGYIGKYTFEGDTDGSDNLEQIGACLSTRAQNLTDDEVAYWYPAGRPFDDTENESLYPAFYFAKNYAKQSKSHVYGTRYEKGFHSAYMLVLQHAVFF